MKKQSFELPLVVQMADEVLTMHYELVRLRVENEKLKEYHKKYIELLDSDIAHNRYMIGSMVELAMKPGVLEAIITSNTENNL